MPRRNHWRIALIFCLGVVAVGIRSDAQQKDKPGPKSVTAQARRDAAKTVYEQSAAHFAKSPEDGSAKWDDYHVWSLRWLQAERDLSRTKAEDLAAIEGHLKRMQSKRDAMHDAVKNQTAPRYFANAADFFVLEAEDLLATARAGER